MQVKERAFELAKAMENEDGVAGAVKAFFKHLPCKKLDPELEPASSSLFSVRRCFGCSQVFSGWYCDKITFVYSLLTIEV